MRRMRINYKMKVVCIKDWVTRYNSKGNPYEFRDPFLVIGKVYTSISERDDVIIFENESGHGHGDTWMSYDRGIFVSINEWRERQLNDLGI